MNSLVSTSGEPSSQFCPWQQTAWLPVPPHWCLSRKARCPCSLHPQAGLGPTQLMLWWMHMARHEPFQPQGQKWGLSSAPYAHSPQAHFTDNRHLRFMDCQTLWSTKSQLKRIFYHHEPWKVLAMPVFAHVKPIVEPSSALVADFLFCM